MSSGRPAAIDPVDALAESHQVQRLITNNTPTLDVPEAVKKLRCALIDEEAAEFRAALAASDIVGVADAIADLLYVVYGAALTFGIPVREIFAEVHRSNMTKLGDDGIPLYREDGKVLKGPNFSPPNILPILTAAGYDPGATEEPGGRLEPDQSTGRTASQHGDQERHLIGTVPTTMRAQG